MKTLCYIKSFLINIKYRLEKKREYCCECGTDITDGKYLMICENCRIQI